MATGSAVVHKDENGNGGSKRTSCPLHGCKRAYTDTSALESHIKEHEIPAQSLPGKVMLCSSVGCGGSFPNMQKLMEHMRHHHKPNIYFLCESCRTKLRSYRGLLTHLHTCSKVPRGKPKSAEPTPSQPPPAAVANITPTVMDQDPPHLSQVSTQIGPSPADVVHSGFTAPPVLGTPFSSPSDSSAPQLAPQQLTEAAPQLPLRNGASNVLPLLNPGGPTAKSDSTDAPDQNHTYSASPESVHPAPGSAPHSPSGYSAVWKRNQGMTHSRRILWEHTKGRYRCVQCGYTATNRKEMTQHINSHHSGNKAVEDAGSAVTNT